MRAIPAYWRFSASSTCRSGERKNCASNETITTEHLHGKEGSSGRRLHREAEAFRAAHPHAPARSRACRVSRCGGDAEVELAALPLQGPDDVRHVRLQGACDLPLLEGAA